MVSKTIDIEGIGKKPATPYKLKGEEKCFQDLAQRGLPQTSGDKPRNMVALAGSTEMGVAPLGDRGFLSAVVHSYNNHYILQTCPDDWWYTIICQISSTIERAGDRTGSGYRSKSEEKLKLGQFLASHEVRDPLKARMSGVPLREFDYSSVFGDVAEQIKGSVTVPELAEVVQADFSTSTPSHVLESEITLRSAIQNHFQFEIYFMCGIPQVEMMGTEDDWRKLKTKFLRLKDILAPVEENFVLFGNWWNNVETILKKLIDTYVGKPDREWWSRIFYKEKAWDSGPPVDWYLRGWFITDFLDGDGWRVGPVGTFEELMGGLTAVPLTFESEGCSAPLITTLVAGIAGIQVEETGVIPKVRAFHGWALFAEDDVTPNREKANKMKKKNDEKMRSKEKKLESNYTAKWAVENNSNQTKEIREMECKRI